MLPILRNRLAGVAPFETVWDMQREMDRLLDTVWGRTPSEPAGWSVPADVVETDNEIRCLLEVPGLKLEDINVTLENNVLTVSGEKKFEELQGEDAKGTYHQERRYGRFDRSFILPRNVDASRVNASYDNGVLTISLPKTEESKPRRVEIRAGDGAQKITAG
ncbi:MAG TPA: Hsp20/alpha crystallin family protein [Longimicrobiales bacterium]